MEDPPGLAKPHSQALTICVTGTLMSSFIDFGISQVVLGYKEELAH